LFILTGNPIIGNVAILKFEYPSGPPVTKNAKTSLKADVFGGANSGYSSDEKTYSNDTKSEAGIKSNCNTAASKVGIPAIAVKLASPVVPIIPESASLSFGPAAPAAYRLKELFRNQNLIPVLLFVKYPIDCGCPVYCTFNASTHPDTKMS
jgi:hypothetical protein